MIREHQSVVLQSPFPEHKLVRGDVGAVVHVYSAGKGANAAYEVEFIRADGKTMAVITAEAGDIRPMAPNEILHARLPGTAAA